MKVQAIKLFGSVGLIVLALILPALLDGDITASLFIAFLGAAGIYESLTEE